MIKQLREKIAAGHSVLGTWSVLNSPDLSEVIAAGGVDFQIIDFEHGAHDVADFGNTVRACHLRSSAALVRLPSVDATLAQKILDAGADGLIFPQVKGFADALIAAKSVQHAPAGNRGFNPFTRYNLFHLGADKRDSKQRPLCAVIIENKTSYDDLDKILQINEIDVIYLGIYDMSMSLGVPADYENETMKKFVQDCIVKCRNAGKVVGLMGPEAVLLDYKSKGVQFLVIGVDTHIIAAHIREKLSRLK